MLTSCKLTGDVEKVSEYYTEAENYYFAQEGGVESVLKPQEESGAEQGHVLIHGALTWRLGFQNGQSINKAEMKSLLVGRDANGRQAGRRHKVIGIDLTFSAPKSVSVAALLTVKDYRILEAHDRAVLETLREIEARCAGTQLFRKGAITRVKTGNMAYVTVRDGFNREHEPHLHTHSVVANMTEYNGKIMALDGKMIMWGDFNHLWGGMYRTNLAAKLRELGYAISYTKRGEWRLDCVSLEVEKAFSTRAAQIKAMIQEGSSPAEAWRETRKKKNPETVKKDVVMSWQETLKHFPEKAAEVNRQEAVLAGRQWFKEASWNVEARQELAGERGPGEVGRWQVAARRATEDQAYANAEAIIAQYLTELARGEKWEPLTYAQAEARFQDQVRVGHIYATDEGAYTTWEMMRADRESVAARKAPEGLVVTEDQARREIQSYNERAKVAGGIELTGIQVEAAVGALTSKDGTVLIQGDAGSGKTTMLRSVRTVAEAAGLDVVGIALQGSAARELENGSGIRSHTVAAYLSAERSAARLEGEGTAKRRGRLVVLDETGMLGSRQQAELEALAARHGDKLVLVGDRWQLESIGAGKPFERLVKTAEASGKLLWLHGNHRAKDKDLAAIIELAREGKMKESLEFLNKKHCIKQIKDKLDRRAEIAGLYKPGTLIVTGTHQAREDLNRRIRDRLFKAGTLDSKTAQRYAISWKDRDGVRQRGFRQIAVDEPITFLEGNYDSDIDVRNGERGTVIETSPTHLKVRREDGREVKIDVSRYNAFDYGYAVVTYKSQGMTIDHVVIEADMSVPYMQDRRNTYVQLTRARESVRIYTDDFWELKDAAAKMNVKRDTLDLNVTLTEAARKEERLKEMARNEVLAKGIYGQAADLQAPRLAAGIPDEYRVSVNNELVRKVVHGYPEGEKLVLAKFAEISEGINKRLDIDADGRRRLEEFFGRRASVRLIMGELRTEAQIAAVEVAIGSKPAAQACRNLSDAERKDVELEVLRLRSFGPANEPEKDRYGGRGRGLGR